MKKIYISTIALALVSANVAAQQLPNAGFEEGWTDCIPWNNKNTTVKTGTTPGSWTIAQVVGMSGIGKTVVGEKVSGKDSEAAVRLFNVANIFMPTQIVPGYVTLGTTWNTSVLGNENDGGSFGGITFTYRPDAISFDYKATCGENSTHKPTLVAYLWKGEWSQKDVPCDIGFSVDGVTKTTMVNRDRNILGIETAKGGEITKSDDAELIAKINTSIEPASAADWTTGKFEFDYASASTPAMINVIFSAGEYFNASPIAGDEITIDNVKLLYYSRLKGIKVNGAEIEGFDPDKYEYTVYGDVPEASAIEATVLGNSGTAKAAVAVDKENKKATVTVTNETGADADGENSHVYTLLFAEKPAATVVSTTVYTGTITIDLFGSVSDLEDQKVTLNKMSDGSYELILKNFGADDTTPEGMGTIDIMGVQLNGTAITGSSDNIELMGGFIKASATLTGTLEGNNLSCNIAVVWHSDNGDVDIPVTFNGTAEESAISGIIADDANAVAEYFNIQGQRVAADNLTPGIYIVRKGGKTSKILVK